ncbi:Thiol:disulfide interchange protein DsbA [Candidatus Erwinia haradaeae]|uniref:Thiol:disulfide interchange protein n=1 Tax=Candidatus Erwinia haradaeae TaxID=1922217 RepID=A0A451DJC3_9GAMM|nr:DsbA family protein [Candidatus Erwinia haradaeae]VFP86805.1 Thiol:disulfide interchange protein DsbA [Candidatus Erwinia haradaeae]
MKNILLLLLATMLTCNSYAAPLTHSQNYICLDQPVMGLPNVLEFFSFYCPHCYEFEKEWRSNKTVQNNFPLHSKLIKYHITNLGGEMGNTITRAWAIAMMMGLEEKVILPIFEGVLIKKNIVDPVSLKTVFIESTGIQAKQYDIAWNSPVIDALCAQQGKVARDMHLKGIPTMIINGKYMINSDEFDTSSIATYVQQYADLVQFLLHKK